jgi:hypothetical protein
MDLNPPQPHPENESPPLKLEDDENPRLLVKNQPLRPLALAIIDEMKSFQKTNTIPTIRIPANPTEIIVRV